MKIKLLILAVVLVGCDFEPSNDYPLYPSCDCDRIEKIEGYIDQDTGVRINYILRVKNDCTSRVRTETIVTNKNINFKIRKCLNQYQY